MFTWVWQSRFDSRLSMGAGSAAMGGPTDVLALDLLFAKLSSINNG
jgi:hypothetical protein